VQPHLILLPVLASEFVTCWNAESVINTIAGCRLLKACKNDSL
jgi:hypothetical protein